MEILSFLIKAVPYTNRRYKVNRFDSSINEFADYVIALVKDDEKRKIVGKRSRDRACGFFRGKWQLLNT